LYIEIVYRIKRKKKKNSNSENLETGNAIGLGNVRKPDSWLTLSREKKMVKWILLEEATWRV
jgi:hypothetical protein